MYEVKKKLSSVEWSGTVATVTKKSNFPLLVKPTEETAKRYNISEDPVLLDQFWIVQRIVAHSLEEEGAYVVGPQLDIPSQYGGTFKYLPDQKGNKILHQTFSTMRDVAYVMPQRVFCLKRSITYPVVYSDGGSGDDKIKSVILQPGEQLNILDRTEVFTTLPASKFLFIGKSKAKLSTIQCVSVMVESTKEVLNLPFSTRGSFATLVNAPVKDQLYDFRSILTGLDLPINLTTTRNCPKTLVDESFLQPGMQLRFSAIEEHEVIIGITVNEKFVEFASEGVEFHLPVHLDKPALNREQEIAYQTALQRFILECQMKDSLINVKDYQKSIRKHISRNVRPTKPTPLHMVAALRNSKYTPKESAANELTAIACFSSYDHTLTSRRSSVPITFGNRTVAPLPPLPNDPQQNTPPLPPRKGRSLKISGSGHVNYPTRPPPPPPDEDIDSPRRTPPAPPFSDPSNSHVTLNGLQSGRSSHDDDPNPHTSRPLDNLNLDLRVPSPPHHAPPSPSAATIDGNQEGTHEIMSPFADSFVPDREESEIFGYVGDFTAQPQNDNSEPKEEITSHNKITSSLYENVTLKFDQGSQPELQVNASPGATSGLAVPQPQSESPEFSLSSSYDNPAYVPSPTQIEMEHDNNDDWQSINSLESPTFGLDVNIASPSTSSHPSPWGDDNGAVVNPDSLQSAKQVLFESRNILNDDSDGSPNTNIVTQTIEAHIDISPGKYSVPASSPISAADLTQEKNPHDPGTNNEDESIKKQVAYENVVLPSSSQMTDDYQNDDMTESKLPIIDVSENTQSASTITKCSDSNNNDIVNQCMLLPNMPAFALDNTLEASSTAISRKYSTSSDSATSTKSSFIATDSSSHKNEYILDADDEKGGDDRGFWISQFSFSNDGRQQVSFACNYTKPPENWTPPNDLSSLSISEVSNSLRFIGMNEETVEWFSAEKVDGQLLCSLESDELSQHFHLSPFQLKKLTMFLKGWRPKEC